MSARVYIRASKFSRRTNQNSLSGGWEKAEKAAADAALGKAFDQPRQKVVSQGLK
jgi:hypothetical protein